MTQVSTFVNGDTDEELLLKMNDMGRNGWKPFQVDTVNPPNGTPYLRCWLTRSEENLHKKPPPLITREQRDQLLEGVADGKPEPPKRDWPFPRESVEISPEAEEEPTDR